MEVLYPALCGPGCAQGHDRGLRALVATARRCRRCAASAPRPPGAARTGRLAGRARLHARGDGSHRRVLEAGVARAGGEFELVLANAAHIKQRARAQDRRQRRHVDRRSARARPDPRQLRAAAGRSRSCATSPARASNSCASVAQHSQRIQKMLEDANLKLGSVVSDILGKSGRAMLDAIVAGRAIPSAWPRASPARQGKPRRAARSAARAHHRASPLHAEAAPRPDRGAGSAIGDIEKEVGLGLDPFRHVGTDDDAGRQRRRGAGHGGGDRRRHVALPHGGPPDSSGPACARATTRAPASAAAPGCAVAGG